MAISMTRAEYEAQYGVAPIFGAEKSKVDTTPSPASMTRAEYTIRYGVDPITKKPLDNRGILGKITTPARESIQGLGELYGGGENGIANKLKNNLLTGGGEYIEGVTQGDGAGLYKATKGLLKAGLRSAGDVANTIFAPISAAIGVTGIGKATESAGDWLVDNYGDILTDNPTFQKFAIEHPNAGEDFNRALAIGLSAFDTGKLQPSTAITRTKPQLTQLQTDIANRLPSAVQKTTEELANIENNYIKTRKANEYSKDTLASRERLAKSGVLENAADDNGLIRTKQKGGAVERYRQVTIDGAEDIVRKGLEQEGKIINLAEVSRDLTSRVMKSGLEGADLQAGLTGVTREIQGLLKRADAQGNIPLYKIHDAKINTTKNINYNTPPETATFRKALASGYKTIVENTSKLPVKAVNGELGKYYADIKRLENLDGLRVKGGKLGKYTSQIAGNIAGGAVGGLTGGLGGVALGTIVGGEVAAMLKGKSMAGTFGEVKSAEVPKSTILDNAKMTFPNARLKLPAGRGGADVQQNIPIEMLPPSSMEAPAKLINRETNSYKSDNIGKTDQSQVIKESLSSSKGSTIPEELQALAQEALKYKSAEEFVKAQGTPMFRSSASPFDVKKMGSDGVFVSPDKPFVERWQKAQGYKNFEEFVISPNAKILKRADFPKEFVRNEGGLNFTSLDDQAKIIAYAKKNGFDGIEDYSMRAGNKIDHEFAVWNKDVIKTKSQLIDIWNKVKEVFSVKTAEASAVPPEFIANIERTLKGIAYNETRGVSGDVYSFSKPSGSTALGKDLGKYQVTEAELKRLSPRYLGRVVTPKEFLASPDLQDTFMRNRISYQLSEGYSPEQIADIHRSGTGGILPPDKYKFKNPKYVESFNKSK